VHDVLKDVTAQLWATAFSYFRKAATDTPVEWTTIDDPACTITGSDDERIAYGLKMKSMAAKLGSGKATFADLWNCNIEILARTWPGNDGNVYDASSADQALANGLAYLFANNGDTVLRVMLEHPGCQLRREKWNRPDYLRGRTIPKALALVKRWPAKRSRSSLTAVPAVAPHPPTTVETRPQFTQTQPNIPTAEIVSLVPLAPMAMPVPALPSMMTNAKDKYDACLDYVERTLESDGLLSFDTFRGTVMIQRGIVRQPMTDTDMINMRLQFEREKNFASISKELMRDACQLVAERRQFDSGIEWLDAQIWDGTPRVDTFMATHFGATDDEYTRAVGRYMWTGLAGRMYEPGCQLDMVVALQSKQGTGKSTGLKALAPDPEYFTDGLSLHEDNDNFKRLMRGKVIVEIAELAGLSKGDINVVKRAITRTTEKWIEKYQTKETSYPRRCMLFASTNEQEFLPPDETGQRRWLPVVITEINRPLVVADRAQLWAEGAAIWKAAGIAYAEAERLAAGRHKVHEVTDLWITRIGEWLTVAPASGEPPYLRALAISEVLEGALRMQPSHMDAKAGQRAGRVLRQLGYISKNVKINGRMVKRWTLDVPPPPPRV
jgi:hypothetical protein